MKNLRRWGLVLAVAAVVLPEAAQAHRAWLLPSATVLSGEDPWITVDGAVSNDLFFFEHNPLRLDGLTILAPDGSTAEAENRSTGRYRSTFDVHLAQPGTYRLALVTEGLFARWTEEGKPKRWRGTSATLGTEVPAAAEGLEVTRSQRRVETFVTAGAPSKTVLEPTGEGLEMVPITHPNDLYAGETARFTLLLDGKPASDVELEIVPGGIRYRDQLQALSARTDAEGVFEVTWPEPGMWWLEASVSEPGAGRDKPGRRAGYIATLEGLPQ